MSRMDLEACLWTLDILANRIKSSWSHPPNSPESLIASSRRYSGDPTEFTPNKETRISCFGGVDKDMDDASQGTGVVTPFAFLWYIQRTY